MPSKPTRCIRRCSVVGSRLRPQEGLVWLLGKLATRPSEGLAQPRRRLCSAVERLLARLPPPQVRPPLAQRPQAQVPQARQVLERLLPPPQLPQHP